MRFFYRLWLPALAAAACLAVSTTVVRAASAGTLLAATSAHGQAGVTTNEVYFIPANPSAPGDFGMDAVTDYNNIPDFHLIQVFPYEGWPLYTEDYSGLNGGTTTYVEDTEPGDLLTNAVKTGQLLPVPNFIKNTGGWLQNTPFRKIFQSTIYDQDSAVLGTVANTTDIAYAQVVFPQEVPSHVASTAINIACQVQVTNPDPTGRSTGTMWIIIEDSNGHVYYKDQVATQAEGNPIAYPVDVSVPDSDVNNLALWVCFEATTSGPEPITFTVFEPEVDYTVQYNPGYYW
jgi:hypothetical protein